MNNSDILKLANKIEEIAKRSWNGSDARAIRNAATILRYLVAAQSSQEPVGWGNHLPENIEP